MHRLTRYFSCFVLLLMCTPLAWGIGEPLAGVGARVVGLGNAFVGVQGGVWSLFQNPAAITGGNQLSVGAYFEQRAFLRELTYANLGVVIPVANQQAVGLDVGSYGFNGFRENRLGMTYAATILERLSMGAKVSVANFSIIDYGSTNLFYVDLGLHLKVTEQINVGFMASNVNRASVLSLTGVRSYFPTYFTLGASYQPTQKVLVVVDVQKGTQFAASFRGGVEYQVNEFIHARLGVNAESFGSEGNYGVSMFAAGFGANLGDAKLDFALSYSRILGYSPHVSLEYVFGG